MRKQKSKIILSKGYQDFIINMVHKRKHMKIGLLIIGNEILEGKISDANIRQLAQFLIKENLELSLTMTVKDQEKMIHQGLSILFDQCDIVLTSGGLGPTKDDLTKEAIASWMGRKIHFSEQAFAVATINYQRFNRSFAGKEHGYCYLPDGFEALENSTGFAPGLLARRENKFLISAPGVPREFMSLLEDHFNTKVLSHFPRSTQLVDLYTVRTMRIPEEKIFGEVDKSLWENLSQYGNVSSLPTIMGVDIGVKIIASSNLEMQNSKSGLRKIFEASPVFPNIWQFGNIPLEDLIVMKANAKNIKYGFAESCTGGLCSHRMTSVSGSSKSFFGSVVCYDESVKEQTLGVKKETLSNFGAVSSQTAEEMVIGVAKELKLDVAISITGLAGPGGGSTEKPVGTAYIGVYSGGKTQVHQVHFPGDREQLKMRFSQAALYHLLEEVEKYA
jgi:nicotinamide-nucleotide amidase